MDRFWLLTWTTYGTLDVANQQGALFVWVAENPAANAACSPGNV